LKSSLFSGLILKDMPFELIGCEEETATELYQLGNEDFAYFKIFDEQYKQIDNLLKK